MKRNIEVSQLKDFNFKEQKRIATFFGQFGNCIREDIDENNGSFALGLLADRINIGTMFEKLSKYEMSFDKKELCHFSIVIERTKHTFINEELCDCLWECILFVIFKNRFVKNLYIPKLDYYYDSNNTHCRENIGIYKTKEEAEKHTQRYIKGIKEKVNIIKENNNKFQFDEKLFTLSYDEFQINSWIKKDIFVLNIYSEVVSTIEKEEHYNLVMKANNYVFFSFEEAESFIKKAKDIEIRKIKKENISIDSQDNMISTVDIYYSIQKIKINSHKIIPISGGSFSILFSDIMDKTKKIEKDNKFYMYYTEYCYGNFTHLYCQSFLSVKEKYKIMGVYYDK